MEIIRRIGELIGYYEMDGTRRASVWVGLVAIVQCLFIYTSTRRDRILIMKLISDLLWSVQYYLFGSLTGAVLTFVAVGRETVFYNRGKHKWADSRAWMWIFIAVMMISPVIETVTSGFSPVILIPAAASALAVIGLYSSDTVVTKSLMLVASLMYLAYNLILKNYISTLGAAAPAISTVIGLINEIRARRTEKSGKPETPED